MFTLSVMQLIRVIIASTPSNRPKSGSGDAYMNVQPQRHPLRRAALAATLLAGTSLGGFAIVQGARADNVAPVNPPGTQLQPHLLPDFSSLVTQVKPAVVSITNKMQATPAALEDDQSDGQTQQLPFPFNQMIPNGPQQH